MNATSLTLIDTLYLYGYRDISHSFYNDYVVTGKFVVLGEAGGYHWYQNVSNDDKVGICEQYQADKMNSYPVIYQYSKKNCHNMSFDTYSNVISLNNCKIKRIDTAITFFDKDYEIMPNVISPFKNKVLFYGKNNIIETFYLGKRSSGKIVRHYNKTIELNSTKNYKSMDYYNSIFGTIDNLYTIEVELTRKHLKSKFGDVEYASIQNIIDYSLSVISSCVFFPSTDENINHYNNNNYEFIDNKVSHYSEDINYISTYKKTSNKASLTNLNQRIHKMINNYVLNVGLDNDDLDNFYMRLFTSILQSSNFDLKLVDVDFLLDDRESTKIKNKLFNYLNDKRNNQTNELYLEAKKEFTRKIS